MLTPNIRHDTYLVGMGFCALLFWPLAALHSTVCMFLPNTAGGVQAAPCILEQFMPSVVIRWPRVQGRHCVCVVSGTMLVHEHVDPPSQGVVHQLLGCAQVERQTQGLLYQGLVFGGQKAADSDGCVWQPDAVLDATKDVCVCVCCAFGCRRCTSACSSLPPKCGRRTTSTSRRAAAWTRWGGGRRICLAAGTRHTDHACNCCMTHACEEAGVQLTHALLYPCACRGTLIWWPMSNKTPTTQARTGTLLLHWGTSSTRSHTRRMLHFCCTTTT